MVKKALSFKKQITNVLIQSKENAYISRIMINKKIFNNVRKNQSKKRLRYFVKRTLDKMEDQKVAIRRKQSYRLTKKIFEKLLKKANNSNKKSTLKGGKNSKTYKKKKSSTKSISTQVSSLNQNNQIINKKTKTSKTKKSKISANQINQIAAASNSLPFLPSINVQTSISVNSPYQKRYPSIWQYYDNNNFNSAMKRSDGWYDYDTKASDIVEDEWQRYIVNRAMNDVRAVKSGEWEYMVDFVNWKQTNIIHQNHKVRPIRRLDDQGHVTKNPYVN